MFKDLNKGALVHIVDSTNIPVYFRVFYPKRVFLILRSHNRGNSLILCFRL